LWRITARIARLDCAQVQTTRTLFAIDVDSHFRCDAGSRGCDGFFGLQAPPDRDAALRRGFLRLHIRSMGPHTSPDARSRPPAAPPSPSIRTVLDALRRIVRDLRLSSREVEREAGVSGAQLFVLQALTDGRAASLNELAERTHTDQSSVSVVVRRLAERKLVARKASRADGRRVELSLTPAGQRLLARCPEPMQARLLSAIQRLDEPELSALTRGLIALVREMGLEGSSVEMFLEEPSVSSPGASSGARAEEPSDES
jgi:DNA-binding MarR family transcriptional regulator